MTGSLNLPSILYATLLKLWSKIMQFWRFCMRKILIWLLLLLILRVLEGRWLLRLWIRNGLLRINWRWVVERWLLGGYLISVLLLIVKSMWNIIINWIWISLLPKIWVMVFILLIWGLIRWVVCNRLRMMLF